MTVNPYVSNYQFGPCRLLGHTWHVVPSDWNPEYGWPMTTRCERCNMERRDTVNVNTGDIESRRYVPPDHYYFEREHDLDELPRRVDFRLAWLNDALADLDRVRTPNPESEPT